MKHPTCSIKGHGEMVLRDTRGQTYEQKWCGAWYDCHYPGCMHSVLIPSPELQKFLAQNGSTSPQRGSPRT